MDFTADFHPYAPDSPGSFMSFTTDYSSGSRRRRFSSQSSSASAGPAPSPGVGRPLERRLSRQLSRQPSRQLASTHTWRRVVFLIIFLLALLAVLLHNSVTSPSPHTLPPHHYLRVVDDSRISPDFPATSLTRQARQEASEDAANSAEAQLSLAVASELRRGGKLVKARKVVRHALSLAPRDPTVLLHYGELLQGQQELVEADHYFARAAAFSETGSELLRRAMELRESTAGKVQELDDAVLSRIDEKKRKFLEVKADSAAMRRAKKEAYFQYIYHTVGIEGNTLSLSQTRAVLETRLAVLGKSVMEHNEVLGMEAALRFINNTLVDKWSGITVQDILEIHRRVVGNVDPLEAGVFRRTQVYVSDHQPPPPSLLSVLMTKFVSWLNSAHSLHPVRHAALAHYKLVFIHPFLDGNGRTSRLLMNLVLMRAGFPPVIVRRSDRETYYNHLKAANEGDVRPFIRFIALCTEKTLEAYLWASREYTMEQGEEVEGDLPPNLVEHSAEQVATGLRSYRQARSKMWLNFAEEEEEEEQRLLMGDGGAREREEVLLTMADEDMV